MVAVHADSFHSVNPEKETRPLNEWLAALRSHYLAAPGMLHRRQRPMVGCQTKVSYLARRVCVWF